ncbi:UDP-glucosyltransferase 2-like [Battus philenor]|uniref:UDP-glucosyltransferase 2-like n=1 Tax=Battus philenor TaxID=42288 RepID=UPI0035D041FA
MFLHKLTFLLILFTQVLNNEALRVLVFFPMPSKSHSILGQGVVSRLLEKGHEVVHVTSFPRDKPEPRLKEIDVSIIGQRTRVHAQGISDLFKLENLVYAGNFGDHPLFLRFCFEVHRLTLEEKVLVDFFSDKNEHFDVAIVEWFFSELGSGIGPLFQCPQIWFGSTEAHWQVLKIIDEIPNTSYNVDLFSESRPPLTFVERVQELWMMLKKYIMISQNITPLEKSVYNSVYNAIASKRGVSMPSYDEAVYNGSLLLVNSHPSIGTPYRLPQNAKYIAGYHIDQNIKPLPKDLQKIMDQAKHGVIYFSMGSNLRSIDMSVHMKESLLKMFGQLKQTVIWKFEEDLKDVPSNIHLVKWAPQLSILAHPNLKIFITHGGQLSTTETIHIGVPVIGIPALGDQYINMKSVVAKGFGLLVNLAEDMAPKIKNAIEEMLNNDSYRQKAKQLSKVYHDRILPPGEELVYWVEYVSRTGGATHLRSMAIDVPLYQKLYLDLIALVVIILYLLVVLLKKFIRTYLKYNTLKSKTS